MKLCLTLRGLVLFYLLHYIPLSYADDGGECGPINCDCSSLEEGKWQDLCLAGERDLANDCVTSHQTKKGYCGFHGPKGTPVATEVQLYQPPKVISTKRLKPLLERMAIQDWSLKDDLDAVSDLEQGGRLEDALSFFNLYRKSSSTLFEEKLQIVFRSREIGRKSSTAKIADDFAISSLDLANELLAYSSTLWAGYSRLKDERLHLSITMAMAQETAAAFERAAVFNALSDGYSQSASMWQKAAEQSIRLRGWEKSTHNKSAHIEFYDSQTKARRNRAILNMLKADEADLASALHKGIKLSPAEVLALRAAEDKAEIQKVSEREERKQLLERLQSYGSTDSSDEKDDDSGGVSKPVSAKDKLKALRGI